MSRRAVHRLTFSGFGTRDLTRFAMRVAREAGCNSWPTQQLRSDCHNWLSALPAYMPSLRRASISHPCWSIPSYWIVKDSDAARVASARSTSADRAAQSAIAARSARDRITRPHLKSHPGRGILSLSALRSLGMIQQSLSKRDGLNGMMRTRAAGRCVCGSRCKRGAA